MKRRELLTAGVLFVMLAGCTMSDLNAAGEARREKPNIIYILSDDLGYGDIGCFGQKMIQTPNLDRMAAEGMRFTQHYAGNTVCAPSRCVLMTGQHAGHCRIRSNFPESILAPEDVTIAEVLKGAGYVTGCIGKWGIGHIPPPDDPVNNGFDYFYGYLNMIHAHNYYPEYLWRNGQKVMLKNRVEYEKQGYAAGVSGVSTNKLEYSHDLFTLDALAFVERHQKEPFFLFLAYTIPHANNESSPDGMEVPDYGIYTNKPWPSPQKGHAAMITRMDGDIGKLLDRLKELGIEKDTLVMFTSDNGPHQEGGATPTFFNSAGPLRGGKRDLYEGGIRVPLIARWPGMIRASTVTDHLSAFYDVLATLADVAGQAIPAPTDGISFLPTLLGKPENQKPHDFLYWEFHEKGGRQAVRKGNWKAVRQNVQNDPKGLVELYDLSVDLGEKYDLSHSHEDLSAEMGELMDAAHRRSDLFPFAWEK